MDSLGEHLFSKVQVILSALGLVGSFGSATACKVTGMLLEAEAERHNYDPCALQVEDLTGRVNDALTALAEAEWVPTAAELGTVGSTDLHVDAAESPTAWQYAQSMPSQPLSKEFQTLGDELFDQILPLMEKLGFDSGTICKVTGMIMDLPQDKVRGVLAHPRPRAALLPRVAAAVQGLSGVGWPGIGLKAIRTLAAAAEQASLLLLLQEGDGRKGNGSSAEGSVVTAKPGFSAATSSTQQPAKTTAPALSNFPATPSPPYDPLTRRLNKRSSEPGVDPEPVGSNSCPTSAENGGGLGEAVGPSMKPGKYTLPVCIPFKPPSVMAVLSRSLPSGPQVSNNTPPPTTSSPAIPSPPKCSDEIVLVPLPAAAVISPVTASHLTSTAISKSITSSSPSPRPAGSYVFNLDHGPPMFLCCPIDLCLMMDPVVTADGYTFERQAIGEIHMRWNMSIDREWPLMRIAIREIHMTSVALCENEVYSKLCRVLVGKIPDQPNDQPASGQPCIDTQQDGQGRMRFVPGRATESPAPKDNPYTFYFLSFTAILNTTALKSNTT